MDQELFLRWLKFAPKVELLKDMYTNGDIPFKAGETLEMSKIYGSTSLDGKFNVNMQFTSKDGRKIQLDWVDSKSFKLVGVPGNEC